MRNVRRQRLFFAVILMLFCDASLAQNASDFVLIDRGDPAYTVFMGVPNGIVQEIREKIVNQPVQVVSIEEFADGRGRLVGDRIVVDEYAGSGAVEGIVELVRKYPRTPFGITWNGGIAFTRMDYQFAKRQFAIYSNNPEEYRRGRSANSSADPIDPANHLKPLLGR